MPPPKKRKVREMVLVPSSQSGSTIQDLLDEVRDLKDTLDLKQPSGLLREIRVLDRAFEKIKASPLDPVVKTQLMQRIEALKLSYQARARAHGEHGSDAKTTGEESDTAHEDDTTHPPASTDASSGTTDEGEDSDASTTSEPRTPPSNRLLQSLKEKQTSLLKRIDGLRKRVSPQGGYSAPPRPRELPSASRASPEGAYESPKTSKTRKSGRPRQPPRRYSPSQWDSLKFRSQRKK